MEFSFGDAYKDGPLALGMHKRGSFYDIVTVDQCQIVEEDFRKILLCWILLLRPASLIITSSVIQASGVIFSCGKA